jgi:ribulose-5-phosphate 4-epimerase/fuculose-1-phosphate aldolase
MSEQRNPGTAGARLSAGLEALKERLAKAHRVLAAGGMLPLTKGHVSARIPGEPQLLMLGHIHALGRTLDTTGPDDLVTVGLDGRPLEGTVGAVGERYIHTEVAARRDDVGAVVHCHPTYATALGVASVSVLPIGNRGGIFAPRVPVLDFDGQIDTAELGALVADALGEGCALVLKNHGIVATGATIENAVVTAFALEETARMQWIAAQVGTPDPLSPSECARVSRGGDEHDEFFAHVWAHYSAMDPSG